MLHKQNQLSSGGHTSTEVKRPSTQLHSRRAEAKEKPPVSPSKDPLSEVANRSSTPLKNCLSGTDNGKPLRSEHQSGVTHISAFDRVCIGAAQSAKNDLILSIVPKDPHLSVLAQTLERQAREFQQKQLIESFPARYNDLLVKEQQLTELLSRHFTLERAKEGLEQDYQKLQEALCEKEQEQADKETKLQRVLEQAEQERQRLLETVRAQHEFTLRSLEQQVSEERAKAAVAVGETRTLVQELEEVIDDRTQKEQQIAILTDALRQAKKENEATTQSLAAAVQEIAKSRQQYSNQLNRLREELDISIKERDQQKEWLQANAFEKGSLAEKLQRSEQERLQYKVQWEQLRLDYNQAKTVLSEKQQSIEQLSHRLSEAEQSIENDGFVIAQLQGEITLKQVELGDKTADIITLKERLTEATSQLSNYQQQNQSLQRLKSDLQNSVAESQHSISHKLTAQKETIARLQDQLEFTRKENGYLLAIRQELEAENDQLRKLTGKYHQQLNTNSCERDTLQRKVAELRTSLEEAMACNQQELEGLRGEVAKYIQQEARHSKQAKGKYQQLLHRNSELEQNCKKLQAAVDQHVKVLASKELEHDKVVSKLIEVSNSRTVLVEHTVLLEQANKKVAGLESAVADKDEQIKSLQGLLRQTRSTILGLSDSLKQRTARQKELFDQVLAEKRRMKKQIEVLEGELRQHRRP